MNELGEVYFEIIPSGNLVKVIAIDANSGVEAVVFGPSSTPIAMLKNNAMKKLLYLLNKKADS